MPTIPHIPWEQKNILIPPGKRTEIIKDKIRAGVYEPSQSSFRSRWFCVEKKTGKLQIVHDLQPLNKVSIWDAGLPPILDDFVEPFSGRQCYTVFDLFWGFDARKLVPISQDLTAFLSPVGLLWLTSMPMGYTNAPAEFQQCMVFILKPEIPDMANIFIDDLPVTGPLTQYLEIEFWGSGSDEESDVSACSLGMVGLLVGGWMTLSLSPSAIASPVIISHWKWCSTPPWWITFVTSISSNPWILNHSQQTCQLECMHQAFQLWDLWWMQWHQTLECLWGEAFYCFSFHMVFFHQEHMWGSGSTAKSYVSSLLPIRIMVGQKQVAKLMFALLMFTFHVLLCHSVVASHGQWAHHGPSGILMLGELLGEKFSPSIWAYNFDAVARLCLYEHLVLFIWLGGVALLHLEVQHGLMCHIINACCNVQVSVEALDQCRSPYIPVDTHSVSCSTGLWLFQEWLVGQFCFGASFTELRIWVWIQLNASDVALGYWMLDSGMHNVAKFAVCFTDHHLDRGNIGIVDFWRITCYNYMVQSISWWDGSHSVFGRVFDGAHSTVEDCWAVCGIQVAHWNEHEH